MKKSSSIHSSETMIVYIIAFALLSAVMTIAYLSWPW